MEKMTLIFYVLTYFGVLLCPQGAMLSPTNNTPTINNESDVESADLSLTTSMTVIKDTDTTENISSITQNAITNISSVSEASTEGTPGNKSTTNNKTTNATKDETTTRSATGEKSTTKAPPVGTTKSQSGKESTTTKTKSTTKSVPGNNGTPEESQVSSSVYIIVILVVICLIIFCIIVFCVYKGDRRRYSVDIHGKNEDAQIPLALVEPDLCDVSPKAMKTFASAEESSPTGTGEKIEEEKAPNESDQQDTKNPAETQATETSAEKPAEPKSLDVSEEDAVPSTKTSVETLNDGLNENNSNNNAVHDVSVCFIDICLND